MSIKLVDSLSPMGSFPVAEAKDIVFADSESLQKKLDDGSLGGGGSTAESYIELSEEEYLALSDEERASEVEYRTYDTGRIFKRGVEFGKETDITSKQDDLHKVKFTMRRNSVNEPRYCLIGSSDLTKTLLMNEPYRFDGTFGSNNNIEKSITSFTVSFKEGVSDPSRILRGFTNNAEGFKYVDLLITVDETENLAYAYVDFLQENSLASGEITKPFLDAESYMDFAESFELVDTYKGTLVCKMSDYCKVITEIDDVNDPSENAVWSSKKTSGEIATKKDVAKLLNNATSSTKWLKLKLGSSSTFQPIIISDQYGGKVEITGMADDGTYKSVKLVRYSYGDWNTYSATDYTLYDGVDPNYKIQRLFYYPTDGYYYLEIRQWTTIKVEGNSTAELVTSLPVETSAMTSIPESRFASKEELAKKPTKYSKTYAGTHGRYIKIGSLPVSSGVVSKATILMSLFSSSDQIEAYPVGFLTINMSSGSNNNRFNINGTTTIPLNNSASLTTPRIVVEKTSTYYNLYVDCKYNYMWIEYMLLQTDPHYVNGNFEALDALEGTEYWSSVTSDDIKYVGDLAKLDDSSTGDENSTWSSSKIASEIVGTKTVYRGNQSIDINTGGKLTFIFSSTYSTSAGCYMLLSNYNVEPTLIHLGGHSANKFNVTATHKSNSVDTITVTVENEEYTWYVLQF